jgi:hypothetical protein
VIVNDFLRQVSPHVDGLSCSTGFHTRTGQALFQQALKLFRGVEEREYQPESDSIVRCGAERTLVPTSKAAHTATSLGTCLAAHPRRRTGTAPEAVRRNGDPRESLPKIVFGGDSSAHTCIGVRSSVWKCQEPTICRSTVD